jgi:M6 family metalloprotease-like protein
MSVNPASVGIQPHNLISNSAYQQMKKNELSIGVPENSPKAPHAGTFYNLAVFIRFSDDNEYTEPKTYFDNMFNDASPNANSMHNYYYEASYQSLGIFTSLYPTSSGTTVVSFQDSHPRNYFRPYNATSNPTGYQGAEKWEREHAMLKAAVNYISGQVPVNLNIDLDNDGNVDNVCFILKGATDHWGNILWPHMATLGEPWVYIHGKHVVDYNVQLQIDLQTNGTGVLCHEMFHTIGAPDLYHYDQAFGGLQPVGKWDLMDVTTNPPQHMCAYLKYKYGHWMLPMDFIPLTTTNYYTLSPLNLINGYHCFRINSPYSVNEFFVVEYRKKTGVFESSLPGEGLIVYRINTNYFGNGGYDGTTGFDEVYAYRPGGSTTINGFPDNANYSHLVGRTEMNCATNPIPYLVHGEPGGLDIREITDNNGSLTFLLLYNVPANIVLNQPDTWGLFAATNEIGLQDGFDTGPSNSFRTIIDECPVTNRSPLMVQAPSLYEIQILNNSNRWISSYTVSSATDIDIDNIRNTPDDKGHFLSMGNYKYVISKEGTEIVKGTMVVK